MNRSVTGKLISYNMIILLVFAMMISVLFYLFYSVSTLDIYKENLTAQALNISETLSGSSDTLVSGGQGSQGHQAGGNLFTQYINIVDDISTADVWIVDENAETITMNSNSRNGINSSINFKELPEDSIEMIDEIYEGNTVSQENSEFFFDEPTITVGTPVYDSENNIIGALLLHMQVSIVNDTIYQGLRFMMIIIAFALVITIILSIFFARSFTLPLKRITAATQTIAAGDYLVRTEVNSGDEIGILAENIDLLAARLEEARLESLANEQLRKDYISNISHELRTPVTIIRGSLEAINDKVVTDTAKVEEYNRVMLNESIHLEKMVNDLLELSRLQNPKYNITKSEMNIIDCLDDAISASRRVAAEKHIRISLENEQKFIRYEGDYTRIRQLFLIILSNAIKFSESDSDIEVRVTGNTVRIKDYGRGIAEENLKNIFSRFYKTSEDNQGGTGLGLAIASEIATRHGIDLQVDSKLNEFTEFTINF